MLTAITCSGVGTKLAMGLTAGALGQLVAVPADLVKVRGAVIRVIITIRRPTISYSSPVALTLMLTLALQ